MEIFPEWQSFHVEIGKLYTYLGEYEKALQSFLLVPDDSGYYEHVSDVYFLQGKRRESIKTLQNGIKKAKTAGDKADAYEVMARFYMDYEREYKMAEAMFKKALQLETRNGELHELEWETAELYFRMGRRKDAAAHAKKALEYFKKTQWRTEEDYLNFGEYRPARLMRHGWIYICLGETEKGLQMFEAMTGCTRCRQCRHEECYESFLYLGMYYEAVGDLKKALDYYKKGLAANGHSIALMAGVKALEKRTK